MGEAMQRKIGVMGASGGDLHSEVMEKAPRYKTSHFKRPACFCDVRAEG